MPQYQMQLKSGREVHLSIVPKPQNMRLKIFKSDVAFVFHKFSRFLYEKFYLPLKNQAHLYET